MYMKFEVNIKSHFFAHGSTAPSDPRPPVLGSTITLEQITLGSILLDE